MTWDANMGTLNEDGLFDQAGGLSQQEELEVSGPFNVQRRFYLFSILRVKRLSERLPVEVLKSWPPVIRSSTLFQASWGGSWGPLCSPDLSKPSTSLRPCMRRTGRGTFLRSPLDN